MKIPKVACAMYDKAFRDFPREISGAITYTLGVIAYNPRSSNLRVLHLVGGDECETMQIVAHCPGRLGRQPLGIASILRTRSSRTHTLTNSRPLYNPAHPSGRFRDLAMHQSWPNAKTALRAAPSLIGTSYSCNWHPRPSLSDSENLQTESRPRDLEQGQGTIQMVFAKRLAQLVNLGVRH